MKILDTKQSAQLIKSWKKEIIQQFVDESKVKLEASRKADKKSLVDSLPEFIDSLCDTLENGETAENIQEASSLGTEHGRTRASAPQYDLPSVLFEYRILNKVLFKTVRKNNYALDALSETIIVDVIHRGVASATTEFLQSRKVEEDKHKLEREQLLANQESALKELENEKRKLEKIFDETPATMALWKGAELRFEKANAIYRKYAHGDIIGKTLYEAQPELSDQEFPRLIKSVFETGVPYTGHEAPALLIRTPGEPAEEVFFDFTYIRIDDVDGKPYGVYAHAVDVTERVNSRKELIQSEARFREIANALPQIIWTATADFEIDWYNDWWYQYLGLPRGTEWYDPDTMPMHPEDVAITKVKLREFVKHGERFEMEQRFKRGSDGTYRWHLVRGVPVKDENGKIVKWVGANMDIQDQKKFVQQLEEERDLRDRFVFTLSHDLRTPLTAAKMSAQMIARKVNDPALQKVSFRISDLMDRADTMIRDLLDASLIRAGEKIPVKIKQVNLNEIAHDVLEELSGIHGDRFRLTAVDDTTGYWDPESLRRILENLCSNAVKYGSLSSLIKVSVSRKDDEVTLQVFNKGPVIPLADQERLFDQFKRADSAKKGEVKGWGLGLTLVKGLAEAHKGSVSVTSVEGEGTTFTIRLPLDAR